MNCAARTTPHPRRSTGAPSTSAGARSPADRMLRISAAVWPSPGWGRGNWEWGNCDDVSPSRRTMMLVALPPLVPGGRPTTSSRAPSSRITSPDRHGYRGGRVARQRAEAPTRPLRLAHDRSPPAGRGIAQLTRFVSGLGPLVRRPRGPRLSRQTRLEMRAVPRCHAWHRGCSPRGQPTLGGGIP